MRRLARAVRLAFGRALPSPPIPSELLRECRVCGTRMELIGHLGQGGIVAEVGTQRGYFAREILRRARPGALHLIDIDITRVIEEVRADGRVQMHHGASTDMLARFPDDHFDWIYIDADHSYAGVRRDIEAARRKVKPGGHLVFNDFAHIDPNLGAYGVHRAVSEFAVAARWPLVWLSYDAHALYDVALRRPAGEPAVEKDASVA